MPTTADDNPAPLLSTHQMDNNAIAEMATEHERLLTFNISQQLHGEWFQVQFRSLANVDFSLS
jgi:hypothetical protein